jgi:quercetin dioxygenase-like cupin family protein
MKLKCHDVRVLLVATILIVSASLANFAHAQEASPTPVRDGVLVRIDVPELPGPTDPDVEVWLVRFLLDPGASVPPSTDLWVSLAFVEQGELTFTVEGPGEVIRFGGQTEALQANDDVPVDVVLGPGDTLRAGTGTRTGVRNDGAARASVLDFLVFSPIEEDEVAEVEEDEVPVEQLSGVTPQGLSVGLATLPQGPGRFTIERVTIEPGDAIAPYQISGAEVGVVEQGTLRLSVDSGQVWVWPNMLHRTDADGMPSPETIESESRRTLQPGDGYVLSTAASETWQVEGTEPVVILRGVVEPMTMATPVP